MTLTLTLLLLFQLDTFIGVNQQNGERPFNANRARRLYALAAQRMSDQPLKTPMVEILLLKTLECAGANATAYKQGDRRKLAGCLFREKSHSRLVLLHDEPGVYLPLLINDLDATNGLRYPAAAQRELAKILLGTVAVGELE